jgi:protein-tyrosine-phosphatase
MTTEPTDDRDLRLRAAGHAALSDVGRLRVVDALGEGDLSPRDLAARLGMSSNLLAHHLKVLQAAGLIRRTPSESDGRRTYVRLLPDALGSLSGHRVPALPEQRLVFVCSGNSARSQLAAAVWVDRTGRAAASAGTRPVEAIHPKARSVARGHGLALLADRPHGTAEVLQGTDAIITVCDAADREITTMHRHWSIPDPDRVGSAAAFERALADIIERVEGWVSAATAAPSG